MKLIALDVGTKRIGVAKADSSVRIAVPYAAVEVNGGEFQKIASLARAWDINCFVLGLPRNSQGEETEQSRYVRQFARELKRAIPDAKICFQDESLTSVEAEKRLKNRKKGYKKGDIDSEAATIILQDFLEQRTGKPASKAAATKHHSVKAKKPRRGGAVLIVILLLLALLGGGAYFFYDYSLKPVAEVDCTAASNIGDCKSVTFVVRSGEGVGDVASNLERAGLIRNAIVFQIYYRLNYSDSSIKPGEYELTKDLTVQEIILTLIGGNDGVFSFTLLPGENVFDFKAKLLKEGYSETAINKALQANYDGSYSWIFEGRPEDSTSLEGYLFADTYEFYTSEKVENIIERMLEEMAAVIKENDLQTKFAEQGLNLYQGITLSSVVQKEANNPADQARVAQVFYNRLHNDMRLDSDVTVIYAWDLYDPNRNPSEIPNSEKIEIDSPYNTRRFGGLPYGPISNPSLATMLATATPDKDAENYLFFLTGDDGMMYYSDTEEGHNNNIQEHCQELCAVTL